MRMYYTEILEFYDENDNLFFSEKIMTVPVNDSWIIESLNYHTKWAKDLGAMYGRKRKHRKTLEDKNITPIDFNINIEYRTHNCALFYIQYKFENLK